MKTTKLIMVLGLVGLSLVIPNSPVVAQVHRTISYQGALNVYTTPVEGKSQIKVTLYVDQFGTDPLWTDTYTADIIDGVFTLQLGSNNPLPDAEALDKQLWLGISVNGTPEMRPLTQLGAAFVALNVADKSITKEKLAPDVIAMMKGNDKQDPQAIPSFDGLTNGTNTGQNAMIVGNTSALYPDGSGGILTSNRFVKDGVSSSDNVDLATSEVNGVLPIANGGTGVATGAWNLRGNSGTTAGTDFIGTKDSVALEFKVYSTDGTANQGSKRVWRIEPNASSPNIIGGFQNNAILTPGYLEGPVVGATIIGGGQYNDEHSMSSSYAFIGGGISHIVDSNSKYSVIVGGINNTIYDNARNSFIGGGSNHVIDSGSIEGVIVGGASNTIGKDSRASIIIGGNSNSLNNKDIALIGNHLSASSYGQNVLGRYNLAQGSSILTNIIGNDRIFQIGNGAHDTARSNAFEVSNNGHSIVYHTNEDSDPAIVGATYKDNVIYAWGKWTTTVSGLVANTFGVDSTATPSTGIYVVVLNTKTPSGSTIYLDDATMVVTINGNSTRSGCRIASVDGPTTVNGKTEFTIRLCKSVFVYNPLNPGLSQNDCQYDDGEFSFIVTGRPH